MHLRVEMNFFVLRDLSSFSDAGLNCFHGWSVCFEVVTCSRSCLAIWLNLSVYNRTKAM